MYYATDWVVSTKLNYFLLCLYIVHALESTHFFFVVVVEVNLVAAHNPPSPGKNSEKSAQSASTESMY